MLSFNGLAAIVCERLCALQPLQDWVQGHWQAADLLQGHGVKAPGERESPLMPCCCCLSSARLKLNGSERKLYTAAVHHACTSNAYVLDGCQAPPVLSFMCHHHRQVSWYLFRIPYVADPPSQYPETFSLLEPTCPDTYDKINVIVDGCYKSCPANTKQGSVVRTACEPICGDIYSTSCCEWAAGAL